MPCKVEDYTTKDFVKMMERRKKKTGSQPYLKRVKGKLKILQE